MKTSCLIYLRSGLYIIDSHIATMVQRDSDTIVVTVTSQMASLRTKLTHLSSKSNTVSTTQECNTII